TTPEWMWPLVVPGWTLNYEMFFYLLFGLCLMVPLQWRAITVVMALVCLVGLQTTNPPTNSIIGFYSSSIVLEFAFGVLLGYLYSRDIPISRVPALTFVFAGSILAISFSGSLPLSLRAIDFGVPAFLIVAGAVFFERAHGVRDFKLARLLGDASYS